MKKQGHRWSEGDGQGDQWSEEWRPRAGTVRRAVRYGMLLKTRKEYRNAVREALKKLVFVSHVGVYQCSIAHYIPSSSPMGQVGHSTELVMRTVKRPCQGIRPFQDFRPPPPGKPGPPPLQGGLGLRPCWYFVRVYVDTPGAGRAGPGGVGGTTSGVVAPEVEHAGDSVRLPGP